MAPSGRFGDDFCDFGVYLYFIEVNRFDSPFLGKRAQEVNPAHHVEPDNDRLQRFRCFFAFFLGLLKLLISKQFVIGEYFFDRFSSDGAFGSHLISF